MLAKRNNLILLSAAALLAVGVVAYFLFFQDSGFVEGRPTFKYFRLST